MRFFSRLFADCAIGIRGGRASVVKGKQTRRLLSEITTLCGECGIGQGEIWIGGRGRISFSKEIPEKYRQRFRNVIGAALE